MTAISSITGISPLFDGRKRTSATISVLLLASAQIAMPLIAHPAFLSWCVIVTLGIATCSFASITWPLRAVANVAVATFLATMSIESIGIRTGVPFGGYSYTAALQPQLLGVPVLVGLAWIAMLLPAWEIARRITGWRVFRALLCGLALVVWDLFLDPQMIENKFWYFHNPHGLNGVPFTNAAGWLVTGAALSLLPARFFDTRKRNNGLAFVYIWMIGFSALGYVVPFALDDPKIGIVGAVSAAPLLYFAFNKREREWLE